MGRKPNERNLSGVLCNGILFYGSGNNSGYMADVIELVEAIFVDIHLVPETAFMVNKIVETTNMGGGK